MEASTAKRWPLGEPEPLSVWQKRIWWIAFVLVALSRFYAVSRTAWDWDEINFATAVDHFDVAIHQPHPPGFPIYVGMAKLVRLFMSDDFRSLQRVNLLAALALFPAMFFLARQLAFSFSAALLASLIFVFLPNIWFFGGTGFSDIPGVATLLLACGFLLAGARSRKHFLLGAFFLALTLGMRPQNLMVALIPGLIATWYRARDRWREILVAIAIGVFVTGGAYFIAASTTGWDRYDYAMKLHRSYWINIDSYQSAERPRAGELVDDFLVERFGRIQNRYAILFLGAVSIIGAVIRRRPEIFVILVTFLPFGLFALFMVDPHSASRYSITYMPMYALLAADGIATLVDPLLRRKVWSQVPEWILGLTLAGMLFSWSLPAINLVRSSSSPPLQAVRWIKRTVDPQRAVILYEPGMMPFVMYYLEAFKTRQVPSYEEIPWDEVRDETYYLTEGGSASTEAKHFSRDLKHLGQIARRRYFDVSVSPIARDPFFTNGWYGVEYENQQAWNWMGRRGEIQLVPLDPAGELAITFEIPRPLVAQHPTLRITADGQLLEETRVNAVEMRKKYVLPRSPSGKRIQFVIETTHVINPAKEGIADDKRDLGVMVKGLSWKPVTAPEATKKAA